MRQIEFDQDDGYVQYDEFFVCTCSNTAHQLRVTLTRWGRLEPPEFSFEHMLTPHSPLMTRFKEAVKYVFGWKSRWAHFDVFVLRPTEIERFEKCLSLYKMLSRIYDLQSQRVKDAEHEGANESCGS